MKKAPVGAHYGLRGWLAQRVTALIMVAYTVLVLLALPPRPIGYAAWRGLFALQWMRLATFVFAASVLVHAWVGVRNILMDYVKPIGLRLALDIVVIALLVACGGWAMEILWRL